MHVCLFGTMVQMHASMLAQLEADLFHLQCWEGCYLLCNSELALVQVRILSTQMFRQCWC